MDNTKYLTRQKPNLVEPKRLIPEVKNNNNKPFFKLSGNVVFNLVVLVIFIILVIVFLMNCREGMFKVEDYTVQGLLL